MSATVLIVNADDFGLSRGVSEGIVHAHTNGIVTSTSLMVRKPAASYAATLAGEHRNLDLGLHIDVGEWRLERTEWVAVYERVSANDPQALRREFDAQLALFVELTGVSPSHIDSHQHAHCREPLRSIVLEAGDRLSIPVRHFTPSVRYRGEFFGRDERGGDLDQRLDAVWLSDFIATLEQGTWELCCHPSSAVDFESDYRDQRLKELKALSSPEVRSVIRDREITLRSFRTIGTPTRS